MNILHLTHTDIFTDSRILKEVESLKEVFNNATIYGVGVTNCDYVSNSLSENLNLTSIRLISRKIKIIPKYFKYIINYIELIFKVLWISVRIKPSLIHCHDVLILPIALLLKFITGAKLVYDAHELESNKNGQSVFSQKITLFTEKLFWSKIDFLIVVSPSIEKWYQENLGFKDSCVILNSPVFGNTIQKYDENYLRNKFEIPASSKVFIYVGILSSGRAIDLIVDVFKQISSAHIVFLGFGEKQSEIKNICLNYNNIHFHEKVSHDNVVPILKSSDIGLCLIEDISLSDYLCLPNKLFEYSFAGIPILGSNFPDITSVINDYKLGYVTDLDIESIYEIITKIQLDDDVCIQSNLDNLKPLSWEQQAEILIAAYRKLL